MPTHLKHRSTGASIPHDTKNQSALARFFRSATVIEPQELKAELLSVVYFFVLFGSYSIVKPVRDAMGTVGEAL